MATFQIPIIDMTDLWPTCGEGEPLERVLALIATNLERRIELLAKSVVQSVSNTTEQGGHFVVYVNGAVKEEGAMARIIQCDDLSASAQIKAMQEAADATYDCIIANKPTDANLLIWRIRPEASRCLKSNGLEVKIYTRLAWDKLRTD